MSSSDEDAMADAPPLPEFHLRTVLDDVGLVLHVPALLALLVIPVALAAGETFALPGLLAVAVGAPAAGRALRWVGGAPRAGSKAQSLAAVAAGWLTVALLAAVPLLVGARLGAPGGGAVYADPWSAVVEGMSGITSTGLTMVDRESTLPASFQLWRSLLQWAGAAGIVLVAVTASRQQWHDTALYEAEGDSSQEGESLREGVRSSARQVGLVYVGLTAAAVLALLLAGERPWVALNHGLTGISTGGFSVTDDSLIAASAPVLAVMAAIMVVGAVSFVTLHALLVRRQLRQTLRRSEVRTLGAVLVAGLVVVLAATALRGGGPGLVAVGFTWASAATTTGFTATAVPSLTSAVTLVVIGGMLIGGSTESTAGGIKLARVAWLIKASGVWLARVAGLRAPGADWRYDGRALHDEQAERHVQRAALIVVVYTVTLAVGTLALALSLGAGATTQEVLFEATSAVGTVGLSSGVTDAALPWHAKAILTVLMWMGRLEVLAVLVLLVSPVLVAKSRRG